MTFSCGNISAWIRLAGDVEMGAESALQVAVDRVATVRPRSVVVELGAVTFGGSVLAHFLAHMRRAVPQAIITVRHASPMIEVILTATGFGALLAPSDRHIHRSPAG